MSTPKDSGKSSAQTKPLHASLRAPPVALADQASARRARERAREALAVANDAMRTRGGLIIGAGAAIALAAAALVILRQPLGERDVIRSKGVATLGFDIVGGTQLIEGAEGVQLQPGDQLRFHYSVTNPSWFAILSSDAAGKLSVYYPKDGHMTEVVPGDRQRLPELDELLAERVLGVFCVRELQLAALQARLARDLDSAADLGCSVEVLNLSKKASR